MREGRELLLDLRTGLGEASSLSKAFAAAEVDLRKIRDVNYKVIVHGEPKALHPVVFEEAYRLGREALVNAFRHSHATSIEAELIYESNALRLRFRDDGIGIDPTILIGDFPECGNERRKSAPTLKSGVVAVQEPKSRCGYPPRLLTRPLRRGFDLVCWICYFRRSMKSYERNTDDSSAHRR